MYQIASTGNLYMSFWLVQVFWIQYLGSYWMVYDASFIASGC